MKVLSLFSGCGGMDLGFRRKGFDIVQAIDKDKSLEYTYNLNHPINIDIKNIKNVNVEEQITKEDINGIIGGPPCQSFSLAGNMKGTKDKRGKLFFDYIKIIEKKKPDFFVIENVPGIISKSNKDEFDRIINLLENKNYNVKWKKLNSAYYDVPQRRYRVFIIGFRSKLNVDYDFPEGEKNEKNQKILKRYGESYPTKKEPYDRKDLNHPNHEHYVGSFSSRYMSRNRVRSWDEPAYTVQANARHQKIHPKAPKMVKIEKDNWKFKESEKEKYRRYSVREASTLQTFPDDFIFIYDNIRDGYKMVGNAVPVRLSEYIAESIKNKL